MGYRVLRFVRFCVLGDRGMLGHTVAGYLRLEGHHVSTIAARFSSSRAAEFVEAIAATKPEWCINAIGRKLTRGTCLAQLHETNVALVSACAKGLPSSVGFLHASSDAVFGPSLAERGAEETPDATDAYGRSKAEAEAQMSGSRRVIIRCSFVGPDRAAPRNLLSWLLAAQDQVNGYTNHAWNGITSLQWAKTALELAESGDETPLVQLATLPPVSKYELLELIASVWGKRIRIVPLLGDAAISRTLIPSHPSPPLLDQLRELRENQSALRRFSA